MYRLSPVYLYAVVFFCCCGLAVVGGFGIAIILWLTGSSKSPQSPAVLFLIPFGALAFAVGYLFLFRMAYRVELTARSIRWRAPLRRGEVPLEQVLRIRRGEFTLQHREHAVIEVRGGRKVSVRVNGRFADFALAVAYQAPHVVDVELPSVSRRA